MKYFDRSVRRFIAAAVLLEAILVLSSSILWATTYEGKIEQSSGHSFRRFKLESAESGLSTLALIGDDSCHFAINQFQEGRHSVVTRVRFSGIAQQSTCVGGWVSVSGMFIFQRSSNNGFLHISDGNRTIESAIFKIDRVSSP